MTEPCRMCGKPTTTIKMVCNPLDFHAVESEFPICEDGHVDLRRPQVSPVPWPKPDYADSPWIATETP